MEYELYEFSKINIPKTHHSVLYSFAPINTSGSDVESLTSYLTRLANVHNIRVIILLEELVKPHLSNQYSDGYTGLFRYGTYKLNGNGMLAKETIKILEHLTKQNLSNLTFIMFFDLISKVKLLKQYKSWCPVCYQEMLKRGSPIYDKLIWTLLDNKYCTNHNQRLSERCRECKSKQIEIKSLSRIGFCQHCNSWLGTEVNGYNQQEQELNEEDKKELLISELLSDLIKHRNSSMYSRENLSIALLEIKKRHFGIPVDTFCRDQLGMNLNAYTSYIKFERVPLLISLIRISLMFNISLKSLLMNDLKVDDRLTSVSLPVTKKKKKRKMNQERAREFIEDYLKEENQSEILPLCKIAEELNWSSMSVRKYFPELCDEVRKKNHLLKKKAQQEERLARIEIIKHVVKNLKKNGIKPTYRAVQKNLPFSFVSVDKEYMEVWRKELNLQEKTDFFK